MSATPGPAGPSRGATARHPSQWLALAVGIIYTIVGIIGFAWTGFSGFADPQGELLLGVFEVNPLHNLAHLIIGLVGIGLWTRLDLARGYGWLLAIAFGALFVYGLVVDMTSPANFLALNWADNWLHLGTAIVGLVMALWPAQAARRDTMADRPDPMTRDTEPDPRRQDRP